MQSWNDLEPAWHEAFRLAWEAYGSGTRVAGVPARVIETRSCERALVTGDAGVGTSRLVEHMCEAASALAFPAPGAQT